MNEWINGNYGGGRQKPRQMDIPSAEFMPRGKVSPVHCAIRAQNVGEPAAHSPEMGRF